MSSLSQACTIGSVTFLTDPQTSGGLLIATAPEHSAALVRSIQDAGYAATRIIGHAEQGVPAIEVVA